jgi:hypothetical protein
MDGKEAVLDSLNKKWRDHKSKLVSKYIHPFLTDESFRQANPHTLEIPPKKRNIPTAVWQQFVAMKTTPAARVGLFLLLYSRVLYTL